MMGVVSASDRKDFSVTCELSSGATANGVLMLETFDRSIGVVFCVARISENSVRTHAFLKQDKASMEGIRAEPPSVFEIGSPLFGKSGESKGKVSKVIISYNLFAFLPLLQSSPAAATNPNAILLAALLARLASSEEMPDFSLALFYRSPTDSDKEKDAQSIWSDDAYTVRWGDIKGRKLWDIQDKMAAFKQQIRRGLKNNQ
jgi:hypothetical protein